MYVSQLHTQLDTVKNMSYEEKIFECIDTKERKMYKSYYTIKASSLHSPDAEKIMELFIENGNIRTTSRNYLCILFSDLDSELYDLPVYEQDKRLTKIYNCLFKSRGNVLRSRVASENHRGRSTPRQGRDVKTTNTVKDFVGTTSSAQIDIMGEFDSDLDT